MLYAKVIIDISLEKLDRSFIYKIPPALGSEDLIGRQVVIPFGAGSRQTTGFVVEMTDEPDYDPDKIREIIDLAQDAYELEGQLVALAAWMKKRYGGTMNQALKTVLPVKRKMKPKEKKRVALTINQDQAVEVLTICNQKNHRARARLIRALLEEGEIPLEIVTSKLNVSHAVIKALEDKQIVEIKTTKIDRGKLDSRRLSAQRKVLNDAQAHAVNGILADYHSGIRQTYLIHGVTGSGKTEVYLDLIEEMAREGRQSIMLIPEIALTYQTVMRFYERFGDRVAIIHSKMSQGERFDTFERAKKGEVDVIIGPRSALFTPFPNLGLIVIDEEHESSYRSEQVPCYHARETAIERARMADASVVLGSATPSLSAYFHAQEGTYTLYTLENRILDRSLPQVEVVDMREEIAAGNKSRFSSRLKVLMAQRLERKEQIMLFLNRRGVAGFVSCRTCGEVVKCPHCDVSLSMHNTGRLVCHYCGHEQAMVKQCSACGSTNIGMFRAGTQKTEEEIKKMFPQARVLRMDYDTTREKEGYEKILSAFASLEADILIGTQMIVKGHDFPNVTLVGVLAADQSLFVPDYTASERTFQLLTQAAGRAGRGAREGNVVIQTYQPDHFSIETASRQDYLSFYKEEMEYRRILRYPPLWHMLEIRLSSASEEMAQKSAQLIAYLLTKSKAPQMEDLLVIGPAPMPVAKKSDIYYRVIYVKGQKIEILSEVKDAIETYVNNQESLRKLRLQFTLE